MATKGRSEQPRLRVISEEIIGEETTAEMSSPTLPMTMPESPSEQEMAALAAATVSRNPAPRATPTGPSTDTTLTRADPTLTASWHLCRATLAVLTAIAAVVAGRVILLLAVLASAILAWQATLNPSLTTLSATGVFDVTVVVPLVWLYYSRG